MKVASLDLRRSGICFTALRLLLSTSISVTGFVAPFRYTAMVWALILGLLMFGEIPDMPTITGTVIIILTGLYSLHRERSVRRSVQEQAYPANQDRD